MYTIEKFMVPEGYKMSEYAMILMKEIKEGKNVEENKDKLFRMTYPLMHSYVMKFNNLYGEEFLVSDMAMAFMRTVEKFDPDKPNASFINYYKMATKTEIIYNYYGKYKKTEKTRQLKRIAEGTAASLEDPVYDKNGVDTGSWHDLIPDGKELDDELMQRETRKDIYAAIDKAFSNRKQSKTTLKTKSIYTDYINSVLDETNIKQVELADKYGIGKSGVNVIIKRYNPMLKNILIERGY